MPQVLTVEILGHDFENGTAELRFRLGNTGQVFDEIHVPSLLSVALQLEDIYEQYKRVKEASELRAKHTENLPAIIEAVRKATNSTFPEQALAQLADTARRLGFAE